MGLIHVIFFILDTRAYLVCAYWMHDMLNHALQNGVPYEWTIIWIKPLHKGGNVNNVSII